MILSDITPNHIYAIQMDKAFLYDFNKSVYTSASKSPVDFLILAISNESGPLQHTVTYEILASNEQTPFASFPMNQPVEEIPAEDLPLYVHMKIKAPNFDRLLKGDPPKTEKIPSRVTLRLKTLPV